MFKVRKRPEFQRGNGHELTLISEGRAKPKDYEGNR